jgi:hypothetical protein
MFVIFTLPCVGFLTKRISLFCETTEVVSGALTLHLTKPYPGYGRLQSTDSTNLSNPWVGVVLLIATEHVQGWIRLGLTPNQSMGW